MLLDASPASVCRAAGAAWIRIQLTPVTEHAAVHGCNDKDLQDLHCRCWQLFITACTPLHSVTP
jgi:hypothetical protein